MTMADQTPATELEDGPVSVEVPAWRIAVETLRKSPLSMVGLFIVVLVLVLAIFGPWIAPFPDDAGATVNFAERLQPPSWKYWFGTDIVGRDVLSRVIVGARISMIIAACVIVLAVLIGVPIGIIAAYWGGWLGNVLMRINEVFPEGWGIGGVQASELRRRENEHRRRAD